MGLIFKMHLQFLEPHYTNFREILEMFYTNPINSGSIKYKIATKDLKMTLLIG